MTKSKRNICYSLYNREIARGQNSRKDFRILRTLICHSDRTFEKVWSGTSKINFNYEAGRLFSEHYRTCHFGYSITGGPVQLYKRISSCTLEDALIYRCYHENFHRYDNKGYLFGIHSKGVGGSLVQFSLDTGQQCREILLSQTIKFKHMSWVEQNEMFVVRSKQLPERTSLHLAIGRPLNIAIIMAVFSAFPLEFVGMFEVDRRVFGQGIHSAILSHGLLIVMYISGHLKFFSFKYILEKFKLFDFSLDQLKEDQQPLSSSGFEIPRGLPINIKITECPPVLFEVRCAEHDVQIGGFPWHYIIQPYKTHGTFQVYTLKDGQKAKQGVLQSQYLYAEADRCVFHNDNSGRILHLRAPEVGVYSLTSEDDGESSSSRQTYKLRTDTVINLHKEQRKVEDHQITSSGRCIKRRHYVDEVASDQDVVIHQVDYEDDLDLAWVSAFCKNQELPNVVCFYDNESFRLLREIGLEQKWDETYEYSVYIDLDTIIQVAKPHFGRFVCTIYRLSGSESPGSPQPEDKLLPGDRIGKVGTSRRSDRSISRNRGDNSSRRVTRRRNTCT